MGAESQQLIYLASTWVVPVLLAITLHEAAHGYVAWRLGDDTAYRAGRVTFNPLRHVDTFGTVVLPAMLILLRFPFLFGWAKPVPVNFGRLGHPRRDMVLVAAAGPASNILMAIVAALLINPLAMFMAGTASGQWIAANLWNAVLINLVLAIFNMLPLPPLDGGRVAVGLLPRELALPLARLERYGLFILLGIVFVVPALGRMIGVDLPLFQWLIGRPIAELLPVFQWLADLHMGA